MRSGDPSSSAVSFAFPFALFFEAFPVDFRVLDARGGGPHFPVIRSIRTVRSSCVGGGGAKLTVVISLCTFEVPSPVEVSMAIEVKGLTLGLGMSVTS